MLPSNRGVCFNWNALVAAAETTFKLLLWMKTVLCTDLRYFLPLIDGSVHRLVPFKAGNRPAARSLLNIRESVDSLCRDGADAQYRPFHVGVASRLATAIYVAMVTPILLDNSYSLNDSNLKYKSYWPNG